MAVVVKEEWDALINRSDLQVSLQQLHGSGKPLSPAAVEAMLQEQLLAPIGSQELWAAGVTYLRSRDARMEESRKGGAADFYQKVYEAERPELFFKALPHRIAAHRLEGRQADHAAVSIRGLHGAAHAHQCAVSEFFQIDKIRGHGRPPFRVSRASRACAIPATETTPFSKRRRTVPCNHRW